MSVFTVALRAGSRAIAAAAVTGALASLPVEARADGLEGAWSGGGHIVLPSGEKERARCRASFRKQGGKNYGMSAVCATASARVQQTAQVIQVSGNRYRGEFFNEEYGISGSVRITVNGDRLEASLAGGGGSAEFALRR